MHDRDLDVTKFSYRSYRRLKKTLGEFDAVVECNEIAIREFIEKSKGDNLKSYIQRLSSKHKVKVDEVAADKFASRIRQYYVMSVFQQSEQFLKDFKEEWKQYHADKTWFDKKTGATELTVCLQNTEVTISAKLIECYEYYRLVRNYMAHNDRDVGELKRRYKALENNGFEFLKELRIDKSPNSLEKIDFDDFLILTNIIKHIAFLICNGSKPSNKTIANKLFELSKEKRNKKPVYQGMKKLKNNEARYEESLRSFVVSNFGRFSQNDLHEIVTELKSLLA